MCKGPEERERENQDEVLVGRWSEVRGRASGRRGRRSGQHPYHEKPHRIIDGSRQQQLQLLQGSKRRSGRITERSNWARSTKSSGTTPMLHNKTNVEERRGEAGGSGSLH